MFKLKRHDYTAFLPSCIYKVNGKEVSVEQVSLRVMNFGQHWRTRDIAAIEYFIALPKRYVIDYISGEFDTYVQDARDYPDYGCELDNELRKFDWPSIKLIFTDSEKYASLIDLLIDFYARDLLLFWFGDGEPKKLPGAILNTIETFYMEKNQIFFQGKGRKSVK